MVVFIFNISIMTQKSGKRGEVALIAPIFDFQDFKIYVNLSVKNAITSRKLFFLSMIFFLILIVSRRQLKLKFILMG